MKKINWNQNWKVWKDKDAFNLVFSVPEDAVCVDLPYDALFFETQKQDSVNGGRTGHLDGGVYNYYKTFQVPREDAGKKYILEFEGVFTKALVYVNGSLAGNCDYPYTDFMADLSDYLIPGEENQLLVVANAMDLSSRYYSGAGIYKDVYLHVGDKVYIEPDSLRFTTLETEETGALVRLEADVTNRCRKPQMAEIKAAVKQGEKVQEFQPCTVRLCSGETFHFSKIVYLPEAALWSDETPELCEYLLSLAQNGETVDCDRIVTGIRTITMDAVHGLRVNGRAVKLRGGCIHHDQGYLGAATYYDYEYRRIKKMKEAGFNAVRSAHNPASRALLAACDALGVYVMDECFDMWTKMKNYGDFALYFEKGFEEVLTAMVRVDYNHPSVVLYSTGNEISDLGTEKGIQTSKKLTEVLHRLDSTRYTTNAINGAFAVGNDFAAIAADLTGRPESDFREGDINQLMGVLATSMNRIVTHPIVEKLLERLDSTMDVVGYNYMTARYYEDPQRYPDRVVVGSETYPRQIGESWPLIMKNQALLGDFTWTGYDYMGEVGPYPSLINGGGDLSASGVRRPVSYYREIVYGLRIKPYIAVRSPEVVDTPREFGPWMFTDAQPLWKYEGKEGSRVSVEVYSAGDEVELFINGESLGRKPGSEGAFCFTAFETTYQPGCVKAVSYKDGQVLGECQLETSGAAVKLSAQAEDYRYIENSGNLVFVPVELRDEKDRLVFETGRELKLEFSGGAKLLAFASNATPHRNGYVHETALTDGGTALVILKITDPSQKVSVKISSEGLESACVEVQ